MSTTQPHVTVESHPDNWQSILIAILQGISIVAPIVIQLIPTDNSNAKVTINPPGNEQK